MDQLAEDYWMKLNAEDRLKLLREYCFWDGFSNYKYDYLPCTLKTTILLKIDCSELK
jgi:hypothetical protein